VSCSDLEYKKTIKYITSLNKFGIKLGLRRIKKLLDALGNPEKDFRAIHVAGTNGKGSVCAMTASILRECGYKTGLYTSPHLIDFRERIIINGKKIPKNDVCKLMKKIRQAAGKMKIHPTYFEVITALAFKYFSEEKVDFAVVEVGMGGRFDATNVVEPEVSIITNVFLEHTAYLGRTIKKIAKEKAGIIKNKRPVITSATGDAIKVIEKKCNETKSNLIVLNKKSFVKKKIGLKNQRFVVFGLNGKYDIETKLVGQHQMLNACCAVVCAELLGIDKNKIIKGLKKASWPGRFETIQKKPTIILDSAHNPDGIEALKKTLLEIFGDKKIIFLVSICSDKDIKKMIKEISPLTKELIITRHNVMNRAAEPEKIKSIAKRYIDKITIKEEIKDAAKYVKNITKAEDVICITGSIFTVAEFKKVLNGGSFDGK